MKKIKLAVIGCGNMAQAIIGKMVAPITTAAFKSNHKKLIISVCDTDENKLLKVEDCCTTTTNAQAAIDESDLVLIAVKPQAAEQLSKQINVGNRIVISIMAGITVDRLKDLTGANKVVRVMPNLNAKVGESFNAYVIDGITDPDELQTVEELLLSFGRACEVKESDMDSITGISGSGPAFVFMTIKAFFEEALSRGFSAEAAKELALTTIIGSAYTVENMRDLSKLDELIDSVCSKGGTTIEGVNYLRENNYETTIKTAIERAINRSAEMSKENK